jgi:hypothetical protein
MRSAKEDSDKSDGNKFNSTLTREATKNATTTINTNKTNCNDADGSNAVKKSARRAATATTAKTKPRLRALKIRSLANEYLGNIALNAHAHELGKQARFERAIQSEFERYLQFNKIAPTARQQTEYFNYYKQKLQCENPRADRFRDFLVAEFGENGMLSSAHKECPQPTDSSSSCSNVTSIRARAATSPASSFSVPSIRIDKSHPSGDELSERKQPSDQAATPLPPSAIANVAEQPTNKFTLSDIDETDYLRRHLSENINSISNTTLSSSSSLSLTMSNPRVSSNNSAVNMSTVAELTSKSIVKKQASIKKLKGVENPTIIDEAHPNNSENAAPLASTTQGSHQQLALAPASKQSSSNLALSNRPYQRTISESSTESNVTSLHSNASAMYNLGSSVGRNYPTSFMSIASASSSSRTIMMNYKPTLFNNLKKLTNEKVLLMSNNSPVGIFSRLPFRLTSNK